MAGEVPMSGRVMENEAHELMEEKKYAEAVEMYEKVERLGRKSLCMFNDMAVALETLNRLSEAESYANKAVEMSQEKSPLILTNRASIRYNLGKVFKAKEDLDRVNCLLDKKGDWDKFGLEEGHLSYIFKTMKKYSEMS